jgi:hypothetical protein
MWKEGGWTRHAKLNPPPDFRLARIISETQFNDNYGSKDDLCITLQTRIMWLKTSYFNIKIFLSHIYSLSRTFGMLVVYFEILYSAFIITFPRKTIVRYLQQAWRYCSALRLCCLKMSDGRDVGQTTLLGTSQAEGYIVAFGRSQISLSPVDSDRKRHSWRTVHLVQPPPYPPEYIIQAAQPAFIPMITPHRCKLDSWARGWVTECLLHVKQNSRRPPSAYTIPTIPSFVRADSLLFVEN